MTKQIIVTDSTSDLSKEYLEANNIHVCKIIISITLYDKNCVKLKIT